MRFVESESGVGFLRKGLSSENREAAVVAVVRSGAMAKSLLKMLEGVETVSVWEDWIKIKYGAYLVFSFLKVCS